MPRSPRPLDAPPPGDPRRADPAWWNQLWEKLAPGSDALALTEETWSDDAVDLNHTHPPQLPRQEVDAWYGWLADPATGPEGAAATPEHLVKGLLIFGSQRPVQGQVALQWLAWHTEGHRSGAFDGACQRPVGVGGCPPAHSDNPAPESGSVSTIWSELSADRQRQMLSAMLRKMRRWPAIYQQWLEPLIANLPRELLDLSPKGWATLAERCLAFDEHIESGRPPESTAEWTPEVLIQAGVPERFAIWLCQDEFGDAKPHVSQSGFFKVRHGLEYRTDWPDEALRCYGRISRDAGGQTISHFQRLSRQTQPPVALFHDWAATEQLHPLMQLQLCTEALDFGERPNPDPDSPPELHLALTSQMARILEQGFIAEEQLLALGEPGNQAVETVVTYWRRKVTRLLQAPHMADALGPAAHRRGLLHPDADIRRLMIQQIGLGRDGANARLRAPTPPELRGGDEPVLSRPAAAEKSVRERRAQRTHS